MFTFYCQTFGCKVSQYETQSQRENWLALGGKELDSPEGADVLFLATCAVTAEAVSDARQVSRKYHKEYPQARQIITGCAATAAPGDFTLREHTDSLVPQTERHILLNHHPLYQPALLPAPSLAPPLVPLVYPPFCIQGFKRARPVLKVQDGCSHKCTYCIVPFTRGHARSRSVEECVAEARGLLLAGHREIMLSGINLRQYHHNTQDFWDLIQALDTALATEWGANSTNKPNPQQTQQARLRISSLDPAQLTEKGLETLANTRMLCPHLHLSLQSGSADVLARMGRKHYTPDFLLEKVAKIQTFWPLFGLGADILMGFPGENAQEVAQTLQLVEDLPLTYAHVFPFSVRPGTQAANLPGHLSKKQKQEHARLVREKVEQKQQTFLEKLCTLPYVEIAPTPEKHMAEKTTPSLVSGLSEYYTECRLEQVFAPSPSPMALVRAKPVRLEGTTLVCGITP